MLIVGLTGGISSGKSTVLKIFKKFGCKTVDADGIAHQLTAPGTKVLQEITKKFGPEILNKKGRLNRKRLAEAIFRDKRKRKSLNTIMHPKIIAEMKRKIGEFKKLTKGFGLGATARKRSILLVDIPLLFEAKLEYLVDKIILVYVPQEIQIKRLQRDDNLTRKQARARINAQIPLHKKKKYADYIINGDLDSTSLRKQVETVWKELISVGSVGACSRPDRSGRP
ncbi:dephospho-CoA kinase [bacterium]|nr:dephospho-CoA kinase [bacterium]NIO18094.1 dephospho-CoA kinase [bacterium]NIO73059.1 dephospho-CoA kinase [bacterium]